MEAYLIIKIELAHGGRVNELVPVFEAVEKIPGLRKTRLVVLESQVKAVDTVVEAFEGQTIQNVVKSKRRKR